jgi:signal peptidase I
MASARKTPRTQTAPGPAEPKDVEEAAPQRGLRHSAWEWTKSLAMGFVLFLVLRTFLIQTFTITSGSMEGTLLVGDFLVLSKSAYGATVPGTGLRLPGYTQPRRGDVVVFRGHHEPIDLVKRLVGLPGDTLEMRAGTLYLNGAAQTEAYVHHTDPVTDGFHPWMTWQSEFLAPGTDVMNYKPTRDNWGPVVVPADRYFVMGDNRDASLDSRYWGFVDPASLKGKAVVLYFSYDREALGPVPFLNHVRWNRIGDRIR